MSICMCAHISMCAPLCLLFYSSWEGLRWCWGSSCTFSLSPITVQICPTFPRRPWVWFCAFPVPFFWSKRSFPSFLKETSTLDGRRSLGCLSTWRGAGALPTQAGHASPPDKLKSKQLQGKKIMILTKGNKLLKSSKKDLGEKSCDVLKVFVVSLKILWPLPPRDYSFLLTFKVVQFSALYMYLRASVLLSHLTSWTLPWELILKLTQNKQLSHILFACKNFHRLVVATISTYC